MKVESDAQPCTAAAVGLAGVLVPFAAVALLLLRYRCRCFAVRGLAFQFPALSAATKDG